MQLTIFSNSICCVNPGIVYAHRNEDVVNVGITKLRLFSSTEDQGREIDDSSNTANKRKTIRYPSGRGRRKRKEFNRVASFMGMREIEFSKWVLSASPLERHKLLENYKKKKKEKEEQSYN
jgi:DNA excision repair protein ERCC-6-like 2